MQQTYWIEPCSGLGLAVKAGQFISVINVEGGQVADFFAECLDEPTEFLSAAVTLDSNESLRLNLNDLIYTNRYRPMFKLIEDDVGKHDLLFPCCRPETYDFFYQNGQGHPNCFDNINQALGSQRSLIQPINLFMHTQVDEQGKIHIHPSPAKAGDRVILQALMDARIGIAACSVSEGVCNNGRCTAIQVVVSG
ncbi:hypothetical protein A4G20_05235 [Pasteurellaceae bacterium RH1A]|nr:hypothetical protein A4G20_05235 [Pasteurellaceae bacterium RH1A]